MSKIALEGNASGTGTLTIASQNTNSNYTLTLPNSTGTLVVTGGAQTIEFAAGTASAPSITTTGDTNTGIFFPAADTIAFAEGGAEAMRITSAGAVGIGTTNPPRDLSIARGSGVEAYASFSGNGAANPFLVGMDGAGLPRLFTESQAISFWTTSTERMRIDSSGNVGIGLTSPTNKLTVQATSASGGLDLTSSGTAFARFGITNPGVDSTPFIGSVAGNDFVFRTNDTERARITSGGNFYVGTTSGTIDSSNFGFVVVSDGETKLSRNVGAASPSFTAYGNAGRAQIMGDGDLENTNGSYGALSDIKIKQDIADAASQWDDIKNIRVRKFRFKNNPTGFLQIGVVAQELEEVSPGLIKETLDYENVTKTREVEKTREVTPAVLDEDGNEIEPAVTETYTEEEKYTEREPTGTTTKSVKYSILYMKAVKALQEAMARIETLEAQNAAFEARLAALENK